VFRKTALRYWEKVVEWSRLCGFEGGCAGGWVMRVVGEWRVGGGGGRRTRQLTGANSDRRAKAEGTYETTRLLSRC